MPPAGKAPSGSWSRHNRIAPKEPAEDGGPWLNLWVGNLSPETVDEDLMAIFSKCSAMDAVTSYLPRPYAFVYFRTIEDAKAAKETLQGISIRGNNIRIEFARPAKPGKTLWVGGISQSIKENQLEDIFMKFGKIEEYKFLRYRGSAFITFYKIDDAIAAQKSMNWKHLGGSEIRVDFQKSPYQRRDWAGERHFRGNTDFLQSDQLLSPDEIKYFHESPHHGLNMHHVAFENPYGERREGQPSNVLWVGYPPELHIDEELLHNSMILFGEIERIQSFPSRHYCYVEFRSIDEARRAKEGLQGRLLGDSRIQILFTNTEQVPGWENFPGQDIYASDPPIGTAELFIPGPNHFSGNLAPNVMPRANMLVRPFTQGFDPHHSSSDFHEFGGGIHGYPDGVFNNPLTTNWKKPSPSAPGIINSGSRMRPPFRPSQGGCDEFDTRELKRSRLDGFSSSDVHFQGGIVDAADMSDFSGLSRPNKIFSNRRIQTPEMQIHQPSSAIPAIDYCWRGIIAKGGTPVCHARCLPIENGIDSPFPDIVNCSARTGLDMLTAHYAEAVGFDMVYFLPDSEDDFASYTEFLRYLGQRDRAGVAKFDDGTTMFLVPPSDFLTKVLKFSGPERLYGVVLKLPHQSTTLGHQLQPVVHPSDPIDRRQQGYASQRNYDFNAQNDHQSLKIDYGSSSHERSLTNARPERPRLAHSEDPNSMPLIAQDHSKRYEAARPDVSLTPELIATLASLIPTCTQPSATFSSQMPSTSSRMPTSFSGPSISDNPVLTMQRWGQEARTTFPGASVEQLYNPMQNLPPSGHPSEAPMIPHFPAFTYTTSGLDNSYQSTMVGMPMQEASLHLQQPPAIIGTLGNAVSSQSNQYQVLPNIQSNDVASFYNLPIRQQNAPTTTTSHNGNILQILADTPVISDKLNTGFPSQAQPLLAATSSTGQGTSEGDTDKDQRYQSTLQFAASLLLQIQQQQQAKAQGGFGSENQQH